MNKNVNFQAVLAEAKAAGMAAVQVAKVTPMIVGDAKALVGPGSGEIDYSKPTYFVADGPCGFAWVNIKPGTHAFCKYLKAQGAGKTDSYYGGVSVWVHEFDQSMQKKEAYAAAFAKVINEKVPGVKAYSMSRMD